jgi:hypothetical protein
MGKIVLYDVEIENGLPLAKTKTAYDKKLPNGRLEQIANQIKHGPHVRNLSAGSAGKLVKLMKHRAGLRALRRGGQEDAANTVYVVSEEWLAEHPDVLARA